MDKESFDLSRVHHLLGFISECVLTARVHIVITWFVIYCPFLGMSKMIQLNSLVVVFLLKAGFACVTTGPVCHLLLADCLLILAQFGT